MLNFYPKKIAVWNTAFLGDAVLTLPLIQALHAAWPLAELHFYTRRGFAPLFAAHPALSAVYEYDKRGRGVLALARQLSVFGRELRGRGYDLWISAHRSARSGFMARSSGAPRRIGYSSPWYNRFFYTDLADRRFTELEEVERLLQLLLPLGLQSAGPCPPGRDPQVCRPSIFLPQLAESRAEELLAPLRRAGAARLLGLHPGSVWATKRWPVEYFAELGRRALAENCGLALFAGPGEEEMAGEAERLIRLDSKAGRGPGLLNLGGALSLTELAACIKRLDCYVSNDSGPMHLAWTQNVPVVALFGPTVRGLGFAPRGATARLLEVAGLPCRPCGLHGPARCPQGHHRCMRDLLPEQVWLEVRGLLNLTSR
jgi:heptosyltransferase-2